MNELRSDAGVTSYLTSVLAFINCLIVSHDTINDRVRIRNELIGIPREQFPRSIIIIIIIITGIWAHSMGP